MGANVRAEGNYEIFRSQQGEQVLSLEGKQFVLTEGPKGEDMVVRQGDFDQEQVLASGEYKFVPSAPRKSPREEARLFLKHGEYYQVVVFPEGLPGMGEEPRRCLRIEDAGVDEVESYVRAMEPGPGGYGGERAGDSGPI